MFPVFDVNTTDGKQGYDAVIKRLKGTTSLSGDAAKAVVQVLSDVELNGDTGVVKYMQKWTDPHFDAARIKVSEHELKAAYQSMDSEIKAAIQTSIDHVMEYQKHCCPKDLPEIEIDGAQLGMRFTPVDSVGCYVP
ncbi:MAG: histidinol dehydrogenase, partial [Pseudomonadales bacterium]|nr:histidinol dehydrogenase [Pseudomonadales bacterium]